MRYQGKVYKDGKFWLAEISILDAMTQGCTRKEVLSMVEDLLETLANRPGFTVNVHPGKHGNFEISSPDTRTMISLMLRRQRESSGLSLATNSANIEAKNRTKKIQNDQYPRLLRLKLSIRRRVIGVIFRVKKRSVRCARFSRFCGSST